MINITPPVVGDPTEIELAEEIIQNQDEASAIITSLGDAIIPNGSFELGTGIDIAPDGWVLDISAGNSTDFTTGATDTRHGRQAFKMSTPGSISGGVTLTSDLFLLAAVDRILEFFWLMKSSLATSSVTISILFYDQDEVFVDSVILYNATSSIPTAWTQMSALATPPAGSKLAKIEILGVNNSSAADMYFDGFFFQPKFQKSTSILLSSGNYTAPVGVNKIKVRMWAGGGGGGGGVSVGSNGGNTYFNGSSNSARGGLGGAPPNNSMVPGPRFNADYSVTNLVRFGSIGGGGLGGTWEGGDAIGLIGAQKAALNAAAGTNTSGGGSGQAGSPNWGGGGGGGEYAEYITSVIPGTIYAYVVGAGGAAGSGGSGNGGSGLMIIEELD